MTKQMFPLILILVGLPVFSGCQQLAFWRKDSPRQATAQQSSTWPQRGQQGPTSAQKLDFMLEMATMFESQGDTQQAIHAYEAVLDQKQDTLALHRLGVLWVRQGDLDKAVIYFHRAIARGGENAQVLCDLGYGLYLAQRYSEADTVLRQAIELDPQLARAQINYGMLLARTGRFDDALYAFSHAGLSESDARNNLALAMLVDKRLSEARAQYEGALRADPENKTARRGLAALHQVQQHGVASQRQQSAAATIAGRPTPSVAPVSYTTR